MVGTRRHVSHDGRVHDAALPIVRRIHRGVRGAGDRVTVTAFRRGDGWAWWSLLVGNTIAFGAAMAYDRIAGAIGPLELSEYLGLAAIYGALAVTAPFLPAGRQFDRRADTFRPRQRRPHA